MRIEENTEELYIAFVDTPGLFASIIRKVIKQDYIHVVLSFDEKLNEAYSIGRRDPNIPFFAGFEKEDKKKIVRKFPTARYMISKIKCTKEQKKQLAEVINDAMENRYDYHYTIIGLPFLLMNKAFHQKNHYTCSSYLAKILEDSGIKICEKHFSLVTPRDFYEYKNKDVVFEGKLTQLIEQEQRERWYKKGIVYEY